MDLDEKESEECSFKVPNFERRNEIGIGLGGWPSYVATINEVRKIIISAPSFGQNGPIEISIVQTSFHITPPACP